MNPSASSADVPPSVFVHPTAVVDAGAKIGAGTRIWHFSHVSAGAVVGDNCSLGQNVFVADGVTLGSGCKVQNNVSLYTGVSCGDAVFIGPSAVFTNVINPRAAVPRRDQYRPTRLEAGVTVGANATILCGIQLGAHCFVGAGAVVTKDVPPYALVVGAPARRVGWMSRAGHRLRFDTEGLATCPETGERYALKAGAVVQLS